LLCFDKHHFYNYSLFCLSLLEYWDQMLAERLCSLKVKKIRNSALASSDLKKALSDFKLSWFCFYFKARLLLEIIKNMAFCDTPFSFAFQLLWCTQIIFPDFSPWAEEIKHDIERSRISHNHMPLGAKNTSNISRF